MSISAYIFGQLLCLLYCKISYSQLTGSNVCDGKDSNGNTTKVCCPGFTAQNNLCVNKNECSSNPCQNGGSCIDGVNMFTCNCAPGYTGSTCASNINECSSNPCMNGGSCIDGVNMFTCNCAAGYTGNTCATNINECNSSPCKRGTCADRVNAFKCDCPAGYTGTVCDQECSRGFYGANCALSCPCDRSNYVSCSRFTGECLCKIGYQLRNCSKECNEGFYEQNCTKRCTCVVANTLSCNNVDGSCTCKAGWRGRNCEEECTDGTYGLNCQRQCNCPENAHHVCKKDSGVCYCKPGYQGESCNTTCEPFTYGVQCLGRCTCDRERTLGCDMNTGACRCVAGWEGVSCELPVPEPITSPVGVVVGSLATIIVIIIIVVVILWLAYKRKIFRSKTKQSTVSMKLDSNGEQSIVYQNQHFKAEREEPSGGEPAYANTSSFHMTPLDRPMLTNQKSEDTYEKYTPSESPYEGLRTGDEDNHLYDGLQKEQRDSSPYAKVQSKISKFNQMT